MFILSHIFGPIIGLVLGGFLNMLGFPPDYRFLGFLALVCLFWCYPAALCAGADYRLLSFASLQHLTLLILWASHGYGGLQSPFLLWLAIVPLLAFLYSPPTRRLWLVNTAMLVLSVGFFAGYSLLAASPPPVVSEPLHWLAALSVLCASAYVAMMAIYFGRVLSSRNELAQEVAQRRATALALDEQVTGLRQVRATKVRSLARLAREFRSPLDEVLLHSGAALREGASAPGAADASDLRSIEEAANRLRQLIDDVDEYGASLLRQLNFDVQAPPRNSGH